MHKLWIVGAISVPVMAISLLLVSIPNPSMWGDAASQYHDTATDAWHALGYVGLIGSSVGLILGWVSVVALVYRALKRSEPAKSEATAPK